MPLLRPSRLLRHSIRPLSTTAAAQANVIVGASEVKGQRLKGSHWANETGTKFRNPWSSFKMPNTWQLITSGYELATSASSDLTLKDAKNLIPHTTPTFGASLPARDLKVTWLGHACAYVELPAEEGKDRGVRVLFDPVLGGGMAFLGMGPKRESLSPCEIEDIPEIDMIAISHNHYDHLDIPTLTTLLQTQKSKHGSQPSLFIPLNNRHTVSGLPLADERIFELDWWEGRDFEVEGVGRARLVCAPSQHFSARYPWDRNRALWASWALQELPSSPNRNPAKLWFAGDTGYCVMSQDIHAGSHPTSTNPNAPEQDVCPAFKEIGEKLGPFTVGLIPIGAYHPREVMSPLHVAPVDSVAIMKDTKCAQAIGIHWGTFRMTAESFTEPPEKLREAVKEAGLEEDIFTVYKLGESRAHKVEQPGDR
ncbi:hypothetical protein L202_06555 [Cryptococcus amylolentus CBS 6039]|uniref:Metallo-beta-lactamase domain-containing protein n=2 Tax=Cryptococcus amylolentus TaxID=104669 RepID=A0A1E3HGC1_9TREE|nr:hypothetical protein L202_06555 [Cryptococcus amylolentus CBS 6039]ODN75398.1 hypothetical protein L202_06555 [Cryptococcus amylolentus CBS 6039]